MALPLAKPTGALLRLAQRSLLGLALALAIAGCAAPPLVEQPVQTGWVTLAPGETIGQTFITGFSGLNEVEVLIDAPDSGRLSLQIYLDPEKSSQPASASQAMASILDLPAGPGPVRLGVPSLTAPAGTSLYAEFSLEASQPISLAIAGGGSYLNGALYRQGQPDDQAQLTFGLAYDPYLQAAGVASELGRYLLYLGFGALLWLLPGAGLLAAFLPGWRSLHWLEKAGLSAGVSAALYPLLLLWSSLAGVSLGWLHAVLPAAIGAGVWLWRGRRPSSESPALALPDTPPARPGAPWASLAAAACLALVFGVRFWAGRSLAAPLWGDSYQHTLITQLLLDHGRLFDSWQPYAELTTFSYHFGFHAQAAAFAWLSGLPADQAVLWTGQLLNGLCALAVATLAMRITPNPWAGAAALLFAGLASPMPMYYSNWGRYTQLAGMLILPAAAWLLWQALETEQPGWRRVGLAGLALAGLSITHLRVVVLAGMLLPPLCLALARRVGWRTLLLRTIVILALAGGLALPWLPRLTAGTTLNLLGRQLSTPPAAASESALQATQIGDLSFYLPAAAWLLVALALAWNLGRALRPAAVLAAWSGLALLSSNPAWFGLPGAGAMTALTVMISAYLPSGALVGAAFGSLLSLVDSRLRRAWLFPAAGGLLLALGLSLAPARLNDIRPAGHALFTAPDRQAAEWMKIHLPANSRLLVNGFFAFSGSLVAGSDGGWWLPYASGFPTSLPPFTYSTEQGPVPEYRKAVNGLYTRLYEQIPKGAADGLAQFSTLGYTHLYVGQLQGSVNAPAALFVPQALLANPALRPVYHRDRVWIFEICPAGSCR